MYPELLPVTILLETLQSLLTPSLSEGSLTDTVEFTEIEISPEIRNHFCRKIKKSRENYDAQ
jgi:hypothetical protein